MQASGLDQDQPSAWHMVAALGRSNKGHTRLASPTIEMGALRQPRKNVAAAPLSQSPAIGVSHANCPMRKAIPLSMCAQ